MHSGLKGRCPLTLSLLFDARLWLQAVRGAACTARLDWVAVTRLAGWWAGPSWQPWLDISVLDNSQPRSIQPEGLLLSTEILGLVAQSGETFTISEIWRVDSNHPRRKRSVIKALADRTRRICKPAHLEVQLNHLKTATQANGYTKADKYKQHF